MKIVIAGGPDSGRETELREPFISIGRETDNDIVLDDQQASRYHAKIEQDGTVWVIKDLESSNGIRLNGRKISQSAPLSPGDEILIGETNFGVIGDDGTGADAVAIKAPESGADAKGAGPKDKDAPADGQQAQKKLRLVLVAVLTLLIVVVIAILLPAPEKKQKTVAKRDPMAAIKDKPLQVYYYRERSGRERDGQPYNIFVFELSIENRTMKVRVQDLVDKLNQEQTAELTVEEEQQLKELLLQDAFLDATGKLREKPEFVERVKVMAMAGHRGNYVEYLNETEVIPDSVNGVISELEKLVDRKTKVNQLPRSVAFAQAERLYISGNKLFAEKDVYPENLYKSQKNLRACIKYLEGYDDPPEYYELAVRRLKEAEEEFENRIEELQKSARFQEKTDLLKAKETYQEIMDRIPDARHKDYQSAKKRIFEINRKLRKMQE